MSTLMSQRIRELEGKKIEDMTTDEVYILRDWYYYRRESTMFGELSYDRLTNQIQQLNVEIVSRKDHGQTAFSKSGIESPLETGYPAK